MTSSQSCSCRIVLVGAPRGGYPCPAPDHTETHTVHHGPAPSHPLRRPIPAAASFLTTREEKSRGQRRWGSMGEPLLPRMDHVGIVVFRPSLSAASPPSPDLSSSSLPLPLFCASVALHFVACLFWRISTVLLMRTAVLSCLIRCACKVAGIGHCSRRL